MKSVEKWALWAFTKELGRQKAGVVQTLVDLRVTAKEICGLSRASTNSRPGRGQPIAHLLRSTISKAHKGTNTKSLKL